MIQLLLHSATTNAYLIKLTTYHLVLLAWQCVILIWIVHWKMMKPSAG